MSSVSFNSISFKKTNALICGAASTSCLISAIAFAVLYRQASRTMRISLGGLTLGSGALAAWQISKGHSSPSPRPLPWATEIDPLLAQVQELPNQQHRESAADCYVLYATLIKQADRLRDQAVDAPERLTFEQLLQAVEGKELTFSTSTLIQTPTGHTLVSGEHAIQVDRTMVDRRLVSDLPQLLYAPILSVHDELTEEIAGFMQDGFSMPYAAWYIRQRLDHSNCYGQTVRDEEGTLVGYIQYRIENGNAHIESISRSPSYARLGIGRELIQRVFAHATVEGATSCTLEVRESNLAARRLYQSLGFVQHGNKRSNEYRLPTEAAIPMKYNLPTTTSLPLR